jgi:hypothetical protein
MSIVLVITPGKVVFSKGAHKSKGERGLCTSVDVLIHFMDILLATCKLNSP